jgi:hypothetical protein
MRSSIAGFLVFAVTAFVALTPIQSAAQAKSVYFRAAMAFDIDSIVKKATPLEVEVVGEDGERISTFKRVDENPDVRKVVAFVANPFAPGAVAPTLAELDAAYEYVNSWKVSRKDGEAAPTFSLASAFGGGSALPSEATIILGLADFMVERARDEMVLAFLVELKEKSADDSFVRNAMPASHNILQQVDALSVQSLMPAFRVAVTEDLSSLPGRLGETVVLESMGISGNARTTIQATSIVYTRVREIRGGIEPMVAIGNLRDLDGRRLADDQMRTPLRLLGLVATDYRFYQDSLQQFVRDRGKRRIYAGFLLHELLPQIATGHQAALRKMIEEQQAEIEVLAQELGSLRETASQARTMLYDTSAVRPVIASMLNVVRAGERFVPVEWRSSMASSGYIDDALEIHEALRQKNYPALVAWLGAAAHTHFRDSKNAQALRYLSFASTLASARTEAEVTTALRTVSAPVGSYRLKRAQPNSTKRPVVVSLNGYVGGGFGLEWTESTAEQEGSQGTQFGAAIPIGLEVSTGLGGGSIGFYIPVIDLGTVTSQRFGGDDESGNPKLGFQQILAPGAYLVWGPWSDKPITVGVGVQSVGRLSGSSAGKMRVDLKAGRGSARNS